MRLRVSYEAPEAGGEGGGVHTQEAWASLQTSNGVPFFEPMEGQAQGDDERRHRHGALVKTMREHGTTADCGPPATAAAVAAALRRSALPAAFLKSIVLEISRRDHGIVISDSSRSCIWHCL